MFSKDKVTIPFNKIAGIELKTALVNNGIVISSTGTKVIRAENFTKADVKQIENIINEILNNL